MDFQLETLHVSQIRDMDFSWMKEAMPERWKKAHRFLREEDRLLCLGAGFLLKRFAGINSEKGLSFNEYGKPFAPGKKAFSISHSFELCAIAISDREGAKIGLDIEKIEEAFPEEAKMIFTAEEKEWVTALEKDNSTAFLKDFSGDSSKCFYRLWTMKESVLKAMGQGFNFEPASFSVLPAFSKEDIKINGENWRIEAFERDGYSISVCISDK